MPAPRKTALVMISSAPVIDLGDGRLRLDVKYVEGMRAHQEFWEGPVTSILRRGQGLVPFGAEYAPQDLGFTLKLIDADHHLGPQDLEGAQIIASAGDIPQGLHLADPAQRPPGSKIVYGIEYTISTRLRIVMMDRERSLLRRLHSAWWNLGVERRRRAAFRAADGVQTNGYPAQAAYGRLARDTVLYLDGRMERAMMATEAEMAARAARLASGAPLRIVHSGRLEPMKGGQDLIPVARALAGLGVDFTLDIFGTGSLVPQITAAVRAAGLQDRVRLHEPVDFAGVLVPHLRRETDLFLSCHRQSDPSCSYLEALSCGVPVAGYDNAMWREMLKRSGGGMAARMGRPADLAGLIAGLDRDRAGLTEMARAGWAFGKAHDFKSQFELRMRHLAKIAAG